jgi:hypothetical protein
MAYNYAVVWRELSDSWVGPRNDKTNRKNRPYIVNAKLFRTLKGAEKYLKIEWDKPYPHIYYIDR